jgi:hypothetical protein
VFLRATARLRLSILGLSIGSTAQRLGALAAWLGYRVVTVGVFGLASLGAFLIFDWPPLLREILFEYLVAFVALRLAMVTSGFLLAPASAAAADLDRLRVLPVTESAARFWHRHLALLAGWFAFGYATVVLLDELGFGLGARHLVAYVLGLGLLAIGLDLVWRRPTAESTTLLRRRMLS